MHIRPITVLAHSDFHTATAGSENGERSTAFALPLHCLSLPYLGLPLPLHCLSLILDPVCCGVRASSSSSSSLLLLLLLLIPSSSAAAGAWRVDAIVPGHTAEVRLDMYCADRRQGDGDVNSLKLVMESFNQTLASTAARAEVSAIAAKKKAEKKAEKMKGAAGGCCFTPAYLRPLNGADVLPQGSTAPSL